MGGFLRIPVDAWVSHIEAGGCCASCEISRVTEVIADRQIQSRRPKADRAYARLWRIPRTTAQRFLRRVNSWADDCDRLGARERDLSEELTRTVARLEATIRRLEAKKSGPKVGHLPRVNAKEIPTWRATNGPHLYTFNQAPPKRGNPPPSEGEGVTHHVALDWDVINKNTARARRAIDQASR